MQNLDLTYEHIFDDYEEILACPCCFGDKLVCFDCLVEFEECNCKPVIDVIICVHCKLIWPTKDAAYYDASNRDDTKGDLPVITADPTCHCQPQKTLYCGDCGVWRNVTSDSWKASPYCTHYGTMVTFPDQTKVRVCTYTTRPLPPAVDTPTYRLTLASGPWVDTTPGMFIEWDEQGPRDPEAATELILDWLDLASEAKPRDGESVPPVFEICSPNAHDRIACALACMSILRGNRWFEAESWVKDNFCQRIELSDDSRYFIRWFSNFLMGVPAPALLDKELKGRTPAEERSWEPPGLPIGSGGGSPAWMLD